MVVKSVDGRKSLPCYVQICGDDLDNDIRQSAAWVAL